MGKDPEDFFFKTYKWPLGTWKYTHHFISSNENQKHNEILIFQTTCQDVFYQKDERQTNVRVVVEKRDPCTLGENVNQCRIQGKQYGGSSKTKNRAIYDPAVPLLDIYPEEMKSVSQRDAFISMLKAMFFIIFKICKQ